MKNKNEKMHYENNLLFDENELRKILEENGYNLKEPIGQGSYGKIYKITEKINNTPFVVKLVRFDESTSEGKLIKDFTLKESNILWNIRQENIIKLYQMINYERNGLLLIIEYAKNGELLKYLDKQLDESLAFAIFYKIYLGVKMLHSNKIIHRDLKLENILINENYEIKICDLGLSKTIIDKKSFEENHNEEVTHIRGNLMKKDKEGVLTASFVGSPLYLSPEIIEGTECFFDSVDVWSLGIILYTLVFNSYPFEVSVRLK